MSDHGFYIGAAYLVTALVIGGAAARIVLDYRRLQRELARYGGAGAREPGERA